MEQKKLFPNYLFEVSWEVCNKVGGIHTVVSTKAQLLVNELKNNYILIGPDVWRDTSHNPEFIEDYSLFKTWKEKASLEGLRVRTGRWNIPSKPLVILVDFTPAYTLKNDIFKILWEAYKVDSLTGGWDYIEPALFGYTAGQVIESFVKYNVSYNEKIVAHFHEWMTGAGLLYLNKNVTRIATVFTTHATILGRSIAGNNLQLYSKLKEFNPEAKAKEFHIESKQSLEKYSAINADCFTTVSEITAKECKYFLSKEIDFLTPNGFYDSFVPKPDIFDEKRKIARQKIFSVTEALLGLKLPEDTIIASTSGRYEFKNKGIDVFIEALAKLNKSNELNRTLVAYFLIPAGNSGPRKDLEKRLSNNNNFEQPLEQPYLTHFLLYPDSDPIVRKLKEHNLTNKKEDKVKIVFVPSYLNNADGIFNIDYYDILIGHDITVYASYYEPWGYTPLESLAFSIPTITTSLSGFANWVKMNYKTDQPAIKIIERTDENTSYVIDEIYNNLLNFSLLDDDEIKLTRQNAYEISRIALWDNFIHNYFKAFEIAIKKVIERTNNFQTVKHTEEFIIAESDIKISEPKWNRFIVNKFIPEKLKPLEYLSENLWWTWNPEAKNLFESIDSQLWDECENNPIVFLDKLPYSKLLLLQNNQKFIQELNRVYQKFCDYIDQGKQKKAPKVAYFSMEFGLDKSLKIYSGGLGILAGDYLKEASDSNYDIIGIGLFYRYGYFKQLLSAGGEQVVDFEAQEFSQTPLKPLRDINGTWLNVTIVLPGRPVFARVWKVDVGRVPLYLLDTDFEDNRDEDRTITHHLYGGDEENRLKQELLLGIGGIRLLSLLNIEPDLYHINEGHAAFIGIERLRKIMSSHNLSFAEALEIVRSTSLFTTHTPVPAGHDFFNEDLLRAYISHYPERLAITWKQFVNLGKANHNDPNERFSMSFLAANLSQEINGVSKVHGIVSQKIFKNLWKGYFPEELHIGYVTNGVHLGTWIQNSWRELLEKELNVDFIKNQSNKEIWRKVYDIPDEKIWAVRDSMRKELIDYIKKWLDESSLKKYGNPRQIIEIKEKLNPKALTIGFARRFATYKRAHLLFKDINRLSKIVNNEKMPVQFVFAGKAHPRDKAGQDLLKFIVNISKQPEFLGKIIFLPNYDMGLAKKLVSGTDIWLNTPTRPLEASGTSGEKAVMNGCLHFSVLDGWWVEGYKPEAGWALSEKNTYKEADFQDELDSEIIYNMLEDEIIPLFYIRNQLNIPSGWIKYIKNSIASIAPDFTMHRMLNDYDKKYYQKLYSRSVQLKENDFEQAREIATWKKRISRSWDNIEVISVKKPDISKETIIVGKEYIGEVIIDLKELLPSDIGIELVIASTPKNIDNELKIVYKKEFSLVTIDEGKAVYNVNIIPNEPGIFEIGLRIFAKNPKLPHRMDFPFVKWI